MASVSPSKLTSASIRSADASRRFTGPAVSATSKRSALASESALPVKSCDNAMKASRSTALPSRSAVIRVWSSARARSSEPVIRSPPTSISISVKACRSALSSALADSPARPSRRMAGSISPVSQSAKPEGWLEASSRSPVKPKLSSRSTRPVASSRVRPGSCAISRDSDQPVSVGLAARVASRIIVSPAMMTGSEISTVPGIVGRGISARTARIASTRSASPRT